MASLALLAVIGLAVLVGIGLLVALILWMFKEKN